MHAVTFEVDRNDLGRVRFEVETVQAVEGEVVLRIDEFAHTANNVTYAQLGDSAGYWTSFPTTDLQWGRIPAWGNATVVYSRCRGVDVGERFYGFVPMASHVVMRPDRVGPEGFTDALDARAGVSPVYAWYRLGDVDVDDASAVLRPVFEPVFHLAFALDAAIADRPGGGLVVITSASSKAGVATAHLLQQRGIDVVAVTSRRHLGFCRTVGCYVKVATYDDLPHLGGPLTVVDLAGDAAVVEAITDAVDDASSLRAGLTHGVGPSGPGALFSAPDQIVERTRRWGRVEFRRRLDERFASFTSWAAGRFEVTRTCGADALAAHHRELLQGHSDPAAAPLHSLVD